MRKRNVLSLLLSFVMVFSLLPAPFAAAAQYPDTDGHWAEAAIERWSAYGVVRGDDAGFRPNSEITRAEAAVVLANLFGLRSGEGAKTFRDVDPGAWYADAIARVSAAGIMSGVSDELADPNGTVTREMLFVMLARGLGIQPQDSTRGAAADGSAWSTGYINALTDKGYVQGDSSGVNALARINRASVMSLLDQTISTYANVSGETVQASGDGITLVAAQDVTLEGRMGDVVVTEGAQGGTLAFSDANVGGTVSVNANANVSVGGETDMNALSLSAAAAGATLTVKQSAKIQTVQVDAQRASLNVSGAVDSVRISESAAKASINTTETARIGDVITKADGTVVSGKGTVDRVDTTQTDTSVTTAGTKKTGTGVTSSAPSASSSGGSGSYRSYSSDSGSDSGSDSSSESVSYVYALMNIPYDKFYESEGAIDAITSATRNGKARNINVNGASFHRSEAAVTSEGIAGVMYPVRATAAQLNALKQRGAVQVTDNSAPISYEMSARGQTSTVTLSGKDILQESPSYSYYILPNAPASCKALNVSGSTVSFGRATGTHAAGSASGTLTAGGRHTEIEISLTGVEAEPKNVSGVTVTAEGKTYALHHVVNIWRGTEIGWNGSDLDLGGKTVTNVRYYLKDGTVTDYATEIAVPKTGYALMNIPYDRFYQAELGENGTVDAITSATLKYGNKDVAGGSYHETDAAEGAEVKAIGASFPVFVSDWSKLDPALEVTAADKKTIHLVSGREKTVTETEAEGKDILFCAPSYSWYALTDKPACYKVMTASEDGVFSFGAASARATAVTVEDTPSVSYHTHHGCYAEVRLGTVPGVNDSSEPVNGVVVTFDDGSVMALPHVQGIWSKTQIGWQSSAAVAEKAITNVKFITENGVYSYSVTIPIKKDFTGELTASFSRADALALTGLPADMENPVATVKTQVGRGETAVTIAENAAITNGSAVMRDLAAEGTTYAITVTSDNYCDLSVTAAYPATE